MLYIVFGEMGIGKNYVGRALAKHLGCNFYDGDDALPESMARKVQSFKPLTVEDIDDYVNNHLIKAINEQAYRGENLVVGQALYLQQHRDAIRKELSHHEVVMVYLPVPSRFTHLRRLFSRKKGFRWALFGAFNSFFFEEPTRSDVRVIVNKNGAHLVSQFKHVLRT